MLIDLRPLGDGSPWGPHSRARTVLCKGRMWENLSSHAWKAGEAAGSWVPPPVLAALSLSATAAPGIFTNAERDRVGTEWSSPNWGDSQRKRGWAHEGLSPATFRDSCHIGPPLFPAGWAHRCCDSEGRRHLQGRKGVWPGSGGWGAVCWCVYLSLPGS